MEAGAQLATEILGAIRSGRDLWVFDRFIEDPDRLERVCQMLIERRGACSDPDQAAFLISVIRELENSAM